VVDHGKDYALKLDPRVTLLDVLREDLRLTGLEKRMRPWAMRRLHGFGEWTAD
jgi:hypothetical protein